jgi:putative ABC transport system permease protein
VSGDRDEIRREIEAELGFHLEERVEALVAGGLDEQRARAQAMLEFGDVGSVRAGLERIDRRIVRRRRRREAFLVGWQEWRQSLRRLKRTPGFLVAVVLTLGLGIGATTAVFALLDGVVLRPLPYPSPEGLVQLRNEVPGVGPANWGWAQGQFLYVRTRTQAFDGMGLYRIGSSAVMEPGAESAVWASVAAVSASMHDVLGARVALGRPLRPDENLAGAAPVVLLGHSYWRRRLRSDPDVVGRMLDVDGVAHEVVGVLAAGARLPEEVQYGASFEIDAWTPLRLDPGDPPRNNHVYRALGRLNSGSTPDLARADLSRVYARFPADLPEAYSERFMEESGFAPVVQPLAAVVIGSSARVLWVLFGAVGIVLAITCTNVVNLFLVRLEGRRRELAIRSVIGASRSSLVRQRLLESMTVAGLSAAVGILVSVVAVTVIRRMAPQGLPRVPELSVGLSEAAFALGVATLIGIAFGLLPGPGPAAGAVLAESGRATTPSRRRMRVRRALIAVQVGLCFVLLAGAGLLLRSFRALSTVDPGFQPAGVLSFRVVLPAEAYADFDGTGVFYRDLTERLSALPGVEAVGLVSSLPLGGDDGCTSVAVDVPGSEGACIRVTWEGPGYFASVGIPLRGRDVTWSELAAGDRVAVISEALARRLFADADPIGRRVRAAATREWHTIVGVAGDVSEGGLDDPASELLYLPVMSNQEGLSPARNMAVLVRTALADPVSMLPAVRSVVGGIDPRVPITRAGAMADLVRRSLAGLTFMSMLLGTAALMALVVAAVGIYGVISYAVAQRRAEIGVRLALGARAAQVRALILGQSIGVVALGVAVGVLLALPLIRVLRAYLFDVSAADPLTLGVVSGLLILVAGLAGHLPARRALRVDPVEALRTD